MAKNKLVNSSLCFAARSSLLCFAVLIPCLGFICCLSFELFFLFLVTVAILIFSTILLLTNTNKKVVILDEKPQPVGIGNLLVLCGQENLPDEKQVGERLLVHQDVKISESSQRVTTNCSNNDDVRFLYSSTLQEAENEQDGVKGLHQLVETLTETAQQSESGKFFEDQVEVLDESKDEKFEVSDDCSVSDDDEEEEEDSLIEIKLQSNLPEGRMREVLGDMSEMNEEENLIEIDISMGSIKFPRFQRETIKA